MSQSFVELKIMLDADSSQVQLLTPYILDISKAFHSGMCLLLEKVFANSATVEIDLQLFCKEMVEKNVSNVSEVGKNKNLH